MVLVATASQQTTDNFIMGHHVSRVYTARGLQFIARDITVENWRQKTNNKNRSVQPEKRVKPVKRM